MRNNYRSKRFKTWLDTLQQESWQLELLISGFAIYGLFQAFTPLEIQFEIAKSTDKSVLVGVYLLALMSSYILAFTLLLHIVLRGLWIGALGLRYVSGDIDFKRLNYAPRFDRYLRRRIGSFDKYISRLEDYCSVLFALSFMLIFYVMSIFLVVSAILAIVYLFLKQEGEGSTLLYIIGTVLIVFISIGMLLVFLDFLTQGFLKKVKWIAFVYFPFYWVFSFITLSFLYRPLVYNFLDNRFGRTISLTLIPIYGLLIFLSSVSFLRSNYMSTTKDSSVSHSNVFNYDTVMTDEGIFVHDVSIPAKVITTNYLPIFIEYKNSIEDNVFQFNPELKPDRDRRGFFSAMNFFRETEFKGNNDSLRGEYMTTVNSVHLVKIDSILYQDVDLIFSQNKNMQAGFETVLRLDSIPKGKHLLNVYRKSKETKHDNIVIDTFKVASIPFWYFKN